MNKSIANLFVPSLATGCEEESSCQEIKQLEVACYSEYDLVCSCNGKILATIALQRVKKSLSILWASAKQAYSF